MECKVKTYATFAGAGLIYMTSSFSAAAENVAKFTVEGQEFPVNCERAVRNGTLTRDFTAWVDFNFYHGGNRAASPIWVLTRPKSERDQRIAQLPAGPRIENEPRAAQMDALANDPIAQDQYLADTLIEMHETARLILEGVLTDCSR